MTGRARLRTQDGTELAWLWLALTVAGGRALGGSCFGQVQMSRFGLSRDVRLGQHTSSVLGFLLTVFPPQRSLPRERQMPAICGGIGKATALEAPGAAIMEVPATSVPPKLALRVLCRLLGLTLVQPCSVAFATTLARSADRSVQVLFASCCQVDVCAAHACRCRDVRWTAHRCDCRAELA